MSLNFFDRQEQYISAYHQNITKFANRYSLTEKKIMLIGIANWTAPSMLTSQDLELEANMLSTIAASNPAALVQY